MKRVVIVHCWGGVPDSRWYPSTKKELERRGFEVSVPAMPDTNEPELVGWLNKLAEVVGEPDESLYLVGHSVGVITIIRWIESLPKNSKIGGLVSVAGFTDSLQETVKEPDVDHVLPPFFAEPIRWNEIKGKIKNQVVVIASTDDPYVPLKHTEVFKNMLGAKVIIKENMGHFSEPDGGGDAVVVRDLPEVVSEIILMSHS